ncbi:fused response regulator/phosphatase [Bacillus sp. FJAT-42376]|uniref:SpoIIE family protein phosphatase n=1 Tax=Bacillus sp. FJAT-42376 TaxID=2014076 RepID=UPI000F4D7938|nr:fused response regulator/phosphatase [Bacillus sp. FJAT-42376]AZB44146.1 fused response regulator/phosphatase [Bacillus sp. FJAT-42376]
MKILIVDDHPVNLFVVEKILKNAGYEDSVSLSSAQALFDYLKIDSPNSPAPQADLILLDIMMPEIDGIETCRRIQQYEHLKEIPIIFVTALEDSNKLAEALDVGGHDYITKPINKVELLARIRVALRLKQEKDWHAEQEQKLSHELDLAMQIQKSLLNPPLNEDNIQIHVSHMPSNKLAGDMYYWHRFNDHKYGVILLDMMGHGISSSLICMYISSVLRDSIKQLEHPVLVIKELNRYMALLSDQTKEHNYYFTAIYLVIDTKAKTVEYVNAGHPPGYALLDNRELVSLDTGSCAVGFFEEINITSKMLTYSDNVQLLLFTDGVYENVGEDENAMLEKLQYIASQKWSGSTLSPIHLLGLHEQNTPQKDDMCLLMIQGSS